MSIKYSLYDAQKQGINVIYPLNVAHDNKKYVFNYPCEDSAKCTEYSIELPRGSYRFELYGASGGSYSGQVSTFHNKSGECLPESIVSLYNGNTKCDDSFTYGGAGGYVRGDIFLKHTTQIYATIGGSGRYLKNTVCSLSTCYYKSNMVPGGYGGGGSSGGHNYGTASGGGQTSVMFLNNSLYNRVIVSGGGGGTDDINNGDSRGGSGGGLVTQGWWTENVYVDDYVANSTFGFTFGTGEAAQLEKSQNPNGVQVVDTPLDKCGGGGGWYGGFSSNHHNGGCGGGSSWALTEDSIVYDGLIESRDEFYNNAVSQKYSFDKNSGFLFYNVVHVPGIWQGNGKLVITILPFIECNTHLILYRMQLGFLLFLTFAFS